MKYIIEKGSVQETLLIPLYGRKMAMDLYDGRIGASGLYGLMIQMNELADIFLN